MSTGLTISSATYGAGSNTVDVTKTVTSKIQDGKLNFVVTPIALNVDDPAPGQLKQLNVSYTINNGKTNTVSAKDNNTVFIDAPPARDASGLQIIKAEYGYVGNYTDVTDAIQNYLSNGSINLTVSPKAVGIPDPNPNKQKTLNVDYTINGASGSANVVDGQVFSLSAPPMEGTDNTTPRGHAMNAVTIVFKNVATFFGVFLHSLSVFTAMKYGEYFVSSLLWGGLAFFIPFFSFWALPILTFWIRVFKTDDFIPNV